jgi:hypothetical protein
MQTQSSSKTRVKNDTVGNDGLKELYAAYGVMEASNFRTLCKSMIEKSTGKRETKDTFIRLLDSAVSKDVMVKKVTNYLLAGQGLGV